MPLSQAMPCLLREFDVRNDADADDHEIGRNPFAGFGQYRFDVTILPANPDTFVLVRIFTPRPVCRP